MIAARRWRGGWELWHEDDCWTQVDTLAKNEQQVRDYLDTIDEDTDHDGWTIRIVPDLGRLGDEVGTAVPLCSPTGWSYPRLPFARGVNR